MPILEKDVPALLEYLGLDASKINSVDEFKSSHDAVFIPMSNAESNPEVIKKISGRILGSIQTKLGSHFRTFGVELEKKEIDGSSPEAIVELGLKRITELNEKTVTELKGQLGKPTEQLEQLQNKYTEIEKKLNAELEAKKGLQSEYEGFKNQVATEKKTAKINGYQNEAWGKFKWAAGTDDLRKEGFKAIVSQKYQIHLDENGEPYPTDTKGERIKSSKKAGEHKSFDEILEEEGMAAKVYAAKDNKGQPAPARSFAPPATPTTGAPSQPEVYIHPSALKAAEVEATRK